MIMAISMTPLLAVQKWMTMGITSARLDVDMCSAQSI